MSKKSHFYTSDCLRCVNRYTRIGRTRREQQTRDKQIATTLF